MQWCVIICQYLVIGSCTLSYDDVISKRLTCGFWLPPADHVWYMGESVLPSSSRLYDREYVACPISEIGVLSAPLILLAPPVSDIGHPKCTTNLCVAKLVIIQIRINLPQFFGYWWSEMKFRLGAVINHAAELLYPGVIFASVVGLKYSSLSMDKSYGSKDNWPDSKAMAQGKRILFGAFPGLLLANGVCFAQYSCSKYFTNTSLYFVVSEVPSSGLVYIPPSHVLYDHNMREESKLCAEMRARPVIGVTWA